MAYMPPEQWQDARSVGAPADIYAFGVILSELFTGRHALLDMRLSHTMEQWLRAHERPAPRLLRSVDDRIPLAIETLYLRCLAADPSARPKATEALAVLQAGARALGMFVYEPEELAEHTPYNEFVHWYQWSGACYQFKRYDEALKRNERALPIARQIFAERPTALPMTLTTRASILGKLGQQAAAHGDQAKATDWDTQALATYQEALRAAPPEDTPEGRHYRSTVYHQLGVFHNDRERWAEAEAFYVNALAFEPNKPHTFFNRAGNLLSWGREDAGHGRTTEAITHLRQARVHAVTSLGMGDPTARRVLDAIESGLRTLGES
jgi:tetratricopeptide (TPR) repeat protein